MAAMGMNHPAPPEPGIFRAGAAGRSLQFLKKIYRWFNLTIVQHAVWPLLVAVFAAPQVAVENTPWNWYVGRVAGPLLATLLALAYIRRAAARGIDETALPSLQVPDAPGRIAQQARYLLIGVPLMMLAAGY